MCIRPSAIQADVATLKGDLIDFEIVDAAAYDRGTSPVERTGDDVNWDEVL